MASFTFPPAFHASGTTSFGPFTIPSGSSLTVTVPRDASWVGHDPTEVMRAVFDVSHDSGGTWQLGFVSFGMADDSPTHEVPKGSGTLVPYTESGIYNIPLATPCQIKGQLVLTTSRIIGATVTIT